MKLQINGEEKTWNAPLTLASLIEQMGLKPDRIAVELNRDIVRREQWAQTHLGEGDRLEIVHFVGGGAFSGSPYRWQPSFCYHTSQRLLGAMGIPGLQEKA